MTKTSPTNHPATWRTYYELTKPGIIYGNLVTAVAGFLLAARGHVNLGLLVATLAGIALVIAGSCVVNNYTDRGVDQRMGRTSQRALVVGAVSSQAALTYAAALLVIGLLVLALWTNWLVVILGLIGGADYLILYAWSKRQGPFGTVVGSLSGALPPVAGYCAVTGRFDLGAALLLIILALWQLPHFFAIAMYRLDDYAAAGLPVLPVKWGQNVTKLAIITLVSVFAVAVILPGWFGYAGRTYIVLAAILGLYWIIEGLRGWTAADERRWARRMFFNSLIVMLGLSLSLAVGSVLP